MERPGQVAPDARELGSVEIGGSALGASCGAALLTCGVTLRHHQLVIAKDRLQRAAALISQLRRLSPKNPQSWRRAQNVGQDVGLAGAHLEQAIRDAEKVGYIQRHADDAGLILLTDKGRAAASQ
jgi:hypothetical protein